MPLSPRMLVRLGMHQLYHATWYDPFLSSWDRGQENSAFVGRELFRQAYSTPPDLYRPSSEQAKRAGPNMTDEGRTGFVWVLVVCGCAWATNGRAWWSGSRRVGVAEWRTGRTGRPPTPRSRGNGG